MVYNSITHNWNIAESLYFLQSAWIIRRKLQRAYCALKNKKILENVYTFLIAEAFSYRDLIYSRHEHAKRIFEEQNILLFLFFNHGTLTVGIKT
jgi:hypothetical protein